MFRAIGIETPSCQSPATRASAPGLPAFLQPYIDVFSQTIAGRSTAAPVCPLVPPAIGPSEQAPVPVQASWLNYLTSLVFPASVPILSELPPFLESLENPRVVHLGDIDRLAAPGPHDTSPPIDSITLGNNRRYQLFERTGNGAKGSVYKAVDEQTGNKVAVKITVHFPVPGLDDWQHNEIIALAKCRGPNVIEVLDAGMFRDSFGHSVVVMAMPLAECTLQELLSHDVPRIVELQWLLRISRGVQSLHQQGIVHGDLKCINILMVPESDTLAPRIGDLGEAYFLNYPLRNQTRDSCGTYGYCAPESLELQLDKLEPSMDIFSLGVIAHALLLRRAPFKPLPVDAYLESIQRGLDLDDDDGLSPKLAELLCCMLDKRASRRPSVDHVILQLEQELANIA